MLFRRYRFKFKAGRTGTDEADTRFSYNWPFDFFSMVELIQLESEIKFAPTDEDVDKALVIKTERDLLDSGVQAEPEEDIPISLIPQEK